MKAVILAGGLGTRMSEETELRPKPMVEIGGKPILWHIMKIYSSFGIKDFIICCGYKGYLIKEYFANYFLHQSDVTIDLAQNKMDVHHTYAESWKITLVDTGLQTMTGGRIKKIQTYIGNETFMLTYGDGVGDVNINDLLNFHKQSGKYATITVVRPKGRFGALKLDVNDKVLSFQEKVEGLSSWVNGGFFVFEPAIFDYIAGDETFLEHEPIDNLVRQGQLTAYRHEGFWQPMDTMREKSNLEDLWRSGKAPWKVWEA